MSTTQDDDGATRAQPPPYEPPAEALEPLRGAPSGTMSDPAKFASKLYAPCEFTYRIYLPAGHDPDRPVALMVFQDGSLYVEHAQVKFNAPRTFDNLIHAGDMPRTIGLFIDPGAPNAEHASVKHENRSDQYDVLNDKYARFLLEEIIPELVTSRHRLTDDPDRWAIGGFSSGGICAFTVAWQRPDKFRRVLTHNGSFTNIQGGHVYPSLIRETKPIKPLRVALLSGTADISDQRGSWLEANFDMAEALSDMGYPYRFRHGTGGHFPPVQAAADFADGLRWLWRGHRDR
jgi:enterochelin esterase family protein